MTIELSQNQDDSTGSKPSSYYKTRVQMALELLRDALDSDLDYVDDMVAEVYREAIGDMAQILLERLVELADNPR